MKVGTITFPELAGLRCLMMPFIQGEPLSVPQEYQSYADILRTAFFNKGDAVSGPWLSNLIIGIRNWLNAH